MPSERREAASTDTEYVPIPGRDSDAAPREKRAARVEAVMPASREPALPPAESQSMEAPSRTALRKAAKTKFNRRAAVSDLEP